MDIRTADRRALDLVGEVVGAVSIEDLTLPTPCEDWDLRALLAHMTGHDYGFAAAARGRGGEAASWADRPSRDPVAAWSDGAIEVCVAFDTVDDDHPVVVPDVRPKGSLPARTAIAAHFLDTMAHGWDVAATVGIAFPFEDDLAKLLLMIAEQLPTDDRGPAALFHERVDPEPGSAPFDRALAALGRDPRWGTAERQH